MTERQKLTAAQLETAIMAEVRKHPGCGNVQGVLFQRREAPHIPNWEAEWLVDIGALRPPVVREIEHRLGAQYDLADD
jgi:hypothetical protein